MIICISSALVVVAWAEPSPTSNHIVSHIPREPVQSSAIAKVGYSKRRHILEIEFVNGAVYRYFDIPLSVHRDLMSAESKARFYDSNIRKHYRSVLVRPRQKEQRLDAAEIARTVRDEFSLLAGTFRLAVWVVTQASCLSRRTGILACSGTRRLGSLTRHFRLEAEV